MPDLNKAYQWAINTCNAPNIGYNSGSRRAGKTVNGITYYDCSSFIYFALKAGGFDVGSEVFDTSKEVSKLLKAGFVEVPLNGEWKAGDVLWVRNSSHHHTEMVYTGGTASGVTMGAHTARYTLDNQVSINTYTSTPTSPTPWMKLLRYGDGATGGYGYSIYVIAALCGNAYRESHIIPNQPQIGGSAYGLFQWDGGRKTALLDWLSDNGYASTDGNGQCEYLLQEPSSVNWIQNYGSYATFDAFMNSTSTDIEELTTAFCRNWERAGVEAMNERIEWANKCLNYINAHAQDSNITDWILNPDTSGYDNNDNDALNNAVMIYRYLSVGGGGGSPYTAGRTNMPIWMMIRYK